MTEAFGKLNRSLPAPANTSFLTDASEDVRTNQGSKASNIKVVCRFRPVNEKERGLATCVNFAPEGTQVEVCSAGEGNAPLKFTFDHVFSPTSPQFAIYEAAARPIVESVLEGFNGTVFAYGQTGSGKTFTMMGANVDDEQLRGIIPRMINTVFSTILSASDHLEFTVKVGYCEIYMEKIKDLLNPVKTNLKVHEDKSRGVYIADLTEVYVSEEAEVYNLMKMGTANREVAATQMNEGSSRSHSLFLMTISQNNTIDFSAKTGKLYLVDLAGSEKVGKTGAEGKRLDEAKTINKSLSTLGLVITSLTDGKSTHVPYRDSKLTRVLQDSLGGNSKTSLIITCSPSVFNEAETISTLRFGIRAKQIKNKPKVNKEYTIAELKLLLSKADAEIARKDRRILQLERALAEAGVKLPANEDTILDEVEDTMIIPPPEMEEMRSQLEDTWQKLSEQAEVSEEYRLKLTDALGKNQGLVRQREDMQKQLHELLNTIHILEERNNELGDQVHAAELLHKTHSDEVNTMVIARNALEEKAKEQEAEIDKLMREMTELEAKADELREVKTILQARDALLTHIAVASNEPRVHELLQQSGHQDAKEVLAVQQLYEQEALKVRELTQANELLKADLEQALRRQVKNLEEVLQRIRTEAASEFQQQLAKERSAHKQELSAINDKQARLLMQLETEQVNYRNLENSMTEGERKLKKKMNALEHSLEQLTVLYNQLVSQKAKMAIEMLVQEKKGKRKQDEVVKLQAEIAGLQKELTEARNKEAVEPKKSLLRSSCRIRKAIKGGRHAEVLSPRSPLPEIPEFKARREETEEERKD